MINHPVTYHRDFRHDFPPLLPDAQPDLWEKCQKRALAAIALLTLYRPCRGPLSVGMSALRSITHTAQMVEHLKRGEVGEGCFNFLHVSLATAAVALFFFNPIFCFLASSVSDLILNSRDLIEQLQKGNFQKAAEAFVFMTLDCLFLLSFCYGSIEITVACMLAQVLLDLYLSRQHFMKGDYFEGVCQTILGAGHVHQAIPQLKVLHWKCTHKPTLTAELKQDENGFVYLDISDEYVYSLYKSCGEPGMELPPYFGEGRAGAHVTAIPEFHGLRPEDIGKKFSFRIVSADSIRPDGWKGVDQVSFLTLSCPQLEKFRTSYGLSPKIDGHDFHLTFGIHRSAT